MQRRKKGYRMKTYICKYRIHSNQHSVKSGEHEIKADHAGRLGGQDDAFLLRTRSEDQLYFEIFDENEELIKFGAFKRGESNDDADYEITSYFVDCSDSQESESQNG
jgi:hypothetical protein